MKLQRLTLLLAILVTAALARAEEEKSAARANSPAAQKIMWYGVWDDAILSG